MVARFVMKFKKQRIISIIAVVTMAILLSFVFVACNKTDGKDPGDKDLIEPPKKELSASEIYRQVNPSVAFVLIENLSGYSSGSGFFIDSNGTLITNYHVIDDGLSGAIQLYDGTVATIDSVIGYDKKLDIAILSTSAKNTSPVKIADSIIQIGETVYAIGYPEAFKLGFSSSTFTSGMVSMNRSIEGYSYIQSTVNITHGNSGGALINKYGEVVGITTSGITYANIDYMNLSIPIQRIDTVSRTANEPLVIVTRRKYPVYATFYSDGAKYTTQTLSYEGRASVPAAPVKAGYTLDGWYADSGFTEKFDFNKKITSDVSIYAKWSVTTYTIDYNLNSGSWNGYSPSTTYTLNDCGYALPVPTREGYIFEGWKNLSGNFISNYPDVNHLRNLSLYASWIEGTEGLMFSTYYTNYVSVTGYNGNADNVVIPKTYRGIPVKEIKDSAFSYQTRLKSITLPDSVTSIGNSAFYGCTGLTTVNWNATECTSAGSSYLEGCSNLATVNIGDNVKFIPSYAFYGCSGLTRIIVDKRNTKYHSAGNCLIEIATKTLILGCKTSVIPTDGSVTSVSSKAFYDCTGLTSITIPDSVTSIGDSAFSGCSGLTSVTIPSSVTNIGDSAFSYCGGLTSITIPDSVTSIGDYALSGCSSLKSITIPFVGAKAGVTSSDAYQYPFGYIFGTSSYTGGVATTQYYYGNSTSSTTSTTYYIPSSLKSVTVTGGNILYGAFRGCTGLTSITIPNSVTSIGRAAFWGCSGLTSITIPESVTNIGFGAFSGCTGLTSVTIPDSVTSIGNYAFHDCTGLTSVTIGNGVTSIGDSAFEGCTTLSSISVPQSIVEIGANAFENCSRLSYVYITDLGNWCKIRFANQKSNPSGSLYLNQERLTSAIIPSTVSAISAYAFYGHSELQKITIPTSVTTIGENAFENCTGLADVNIASIEKWCGLIFQNNKSNPLTYANNLYCNDKLVTTLVTASTVSKIESYAFYNYSKLRSIDISNGIKAIGDSAFYNCTGLTSIEIPSNISSINSNAFEKCRYLSSITAPTYVASNIAKTCGSNSFRIVINGGSSINDSAFSNCSSLTSIEISNTVRSIGQLAFSGCTKLKSITIPKSVTSIGKGAFSNCYNLQSMVIPFVGAKAGVTSSNTYQYPFGYIFGESFASNAVEQRYYGSSLSQTTSSKYAIPASLKEVSVTGGSILRGAFYNCKNLTSVTMYDGVSSIGDYAFYLCNGLTDFSFAQSILSIGESAFYGCSFTSISIPRNVSNIGIGAFSECNKIESVTIPFVGLNETSPNSYERVFGAIFGIKATTGSASSNIANATCQGFLYDTVNKAYNYYWYKIPNTLKTVTVLDGSTTIPENAFHNCSWITTFDLPDSIQSIGNGAFYNCDGLIDFSVPFSTTKIGISAFSNCDNLTSFTLNNGTREIGGNAFYECKSLTNVTISSSVTKIGESAFRGCSELTNIIFNGTKAQWISISKGNNWNLYVPSTCKVVCTDGTISISVA